MFSQLLRTSSLLLLLVSCSVVTRAEVVWIDVRSALEHRWDHIDGDARISYDEIVQEISAIVPDKNTEVHL